MCLQTCLYISYGLFSLTTVDGVDTQCTRRGNILLVIIQKQHLRGSHIQTLAGQFIDAWVGFSDTFLVSINDQIPISKTTARIGMFHPFLVEIFVHNYICYRVRSHISTSISVSIVKLN